MPELIKIIFIVLFLIFGFVNVSFANYTFIEPFDTAVFSSWITISEHVTPTISTSDERFYAHFHSGSSNSFAYLGHKSSSENIISVSFDFKYELGAVTQGAGFMLTNKVPIVSQNPPSDNGDYSVGIWPISGKFYLLSPLCDNIPSCGLSIYSRAFFEINSGTWSNISIKYYSDHLDVKLNNELKTLPYGTFPLPNGFFFGNSVLATNPQTWLDFYIDNLSVVYGNPSSPSFPYLSQSDALWGSQEYDSAHVWAAVGKEGIDRWGCALTSVAMILQNYGVKTLDGTTMTPDVLNTWLRSQSDGYIGAGLLNWLAVTRYVKESYLAGQADTKLEFARSYPPSVPELPSILGTVGHFVVAHDEDLTSWSINDPASESITSLPKTTTLRSINRYIPSLTDLSYMMFVMNPGMSASLKNSMGETVPLTWINEYLSDEIDGSDSGSVQTAMLPKPSNDTYTLTVNQPEGEVNELKILLYDETANEASPSAFGVTEPVSNYKILYASESAGIRSAEEVDLVAPPVPSLLSPEDGAVATASGLILDWLDVSDPSEPVSYNYKSLWSGGSYGPVTTGGESFFDLSGSLDNTFTWYVQACDAKGNCSEWSTGRTVVVDSTAPTLPTAPATSPSPTNLTTQDWSWMPGSDSGSGILGYSTRTYNVAADDYLTGWLWIGDVLSTATNLDEGKWRLQLMASDVAGNQSESVSSETLTVDTTAPVLSAQTSFEDKWYGSVQTVTFVYSDANILDSYQDPSCTITTESTASYCWVKPYICDKAGNCNNDKKYSQNIKLDMTKPSVLLNVWGRELKGTAYDSLSGVAKVMIQLTKPGESTTTVTADGTTAWNYVINDAKLGKYKIVVTAYDEADNASIETIKEYDINASEGGESSATPSPTPTPTPQPNSDSVVLGESIQVIDSPMPSAILENFDNGQVLGETAHPKKMDYRWLGLIAPISLSVYLLARKK